MKCIWCKKDHNSPSKEHIIPEPLGCPDGFLLTKGEVCLSCNNSLSHLDHAVIQDFDFLLFFNEIPRKSGKLPEISTRGNVIGYNKENEKVIFFNYDNKDKVSIDGRLAYPRGKSKVSFKSTIGADPKFTRGILKIAFSSMVYYFGASQFLKAEYDSIRNYVVDGKGERKIILIPADDQNYFNEVRLIPSNSGNEWLIQLRLGYVQFLIDVTPDMSVFPLLKEKAKALYGDSGWTYLPIQ